jgi:NADH dehydrogenase
MEDDPEARTAQLTFVVVGGGATGVELAGALREIAVESIQRDFRRVDTTTARIVLVEGQSKLLGSMHEASSQRALRDLEKMGVEVRLNTLLTELSEDRVTLKRGEHSETLLARNVIWAAGVRASSLGRTLNVPLDKQGRVIVNSDCSIPDHRNAFVIGDMAALTDEASGKSVPGVAQGALQMGEHVAGLIKAEFLDSEASRRAFRYRDKGSMATIGRAKAVADLGTRSYGGLVAWLLWSLIHVAFLVSFRTRLFVMLGWAWSYVAQVKGARLITGNRGPDVKETHDF